MCAKACLRVDLESILDHFEFKMYQSKRKKNKFCNVSEQENFFFLQCYQKRFYNISEKISQCIRANFIMYQSKFYNVSEQVKKNFRMYQSKLNFLRCIKINKISKDVSEQFEILKYIIAYLNF